MRVVPFFNPFTFEVVARRGFEPRQTEPKSVVLPLYYRAITKNGLQMYDSIREVPNQSRHSYTLGKPVIMKSMLPIRRVRMIGFRVLLLFQAFNKFESVWNNIAHYRDQ